jgi:hypothetical protein
MVTDDYEVEVSGDDRSPTLESDSDGEQPGGFCVPKPKAKADQQRAAASRELSCLVGTQLAAAASLNRRQSISLATLPWETGWVGKVLGLDKQRKWPYFDPVVPGMNRLDPLGEQPDVETQATLKRYKIAGKTAWARVKIAKNVLTPDALRNRTLLQWRMVLEDDLEASLAGLQILELAETAADPGEITQMLEHLFAGKATATLTKRVDKLLDYRKWARRNGVERPWLFKESHVYRYCKYMAGPCFGATAAASFLSAVRFFSAVFESSRAMQTSDSARIKGVCKLKNLTKRPTKQAPPLKVEEVMALESAAIWMDDPMDRVAAGQFVFDVYSCSRHSDPMGAEALGVEVNNDEEFNGFVELHTRDYKNASTVARKTTFLPLTATTKGLIKDSWAKGWLEARSQTGLIVGQGPMLPAPSTSTGKWLERRLSSAEATSWLRELLVASGTKYARALEISTHSLKTTVLSWAAKFGMTVEERRMLGHHCDPQLKSVVTYSRDSMFAPLMRVNEMLKAIREGSEEVEPPSEAAVWTIADIDGTTTDVRVETETGQQIRCETEVVAPVEEVVQEQPPQEAQHLVGLTDSEHGDASGSSDSSSSSSSDSLTEADLQLPVLDDDCLDDMEAVGEAGVFRVEEHIVCQHRLSGMLHVRSQTEGRFLCNRVHTAIYDRIKKPLKYQWPECLQCKSRLSDLETA